MSFTVDANALVGLPDLLDRLGDDAQAARAYAATYTQLHWGGLLSLITAGHTHAVAETDAFLATVGGRIAHDDAVRVRAAIDYYRRTDAAAAARVDATIAHPMSPDEPVLTAGAHPGLFGDVAHTRDALVPPRDHHADMPFTPKWTELLSPTAAARTAIWVVTSLGAKLGFCDRAHDVVAEVVEPLSGDWAGLLRCAEVFERLAGASAAMSSNVQWGAVCLDRVWSGHAADSCEEVLVLVDTALAEAQEPFRGLAEQYRTAAEEVHSINELMAELVGDLVDYAVIAALDVEAGAATGETVIGPVLFGAGAAYEIEKACVLFHRIVELVDKARQVAEWLDTALHGFGLLPGRQLPALSTTTPALPA